MRAWIVSIVASLCCGCFVLDEFDKGDEIMRQVSPRGGAKKAAPPSGSSDGKSISAELLDSAKKWWSKATAPAATERDPNDGVVRCRVGGGVQYMRASDCEIRGGEQA